MKRLSVFTFSTLLVLLFLTDAKAQDMRFGVQAGAHFAWMNSRDDNVTSKSPRMGFKYGLMLDKYFSERYAINTGFILNDVGGTIEYKDPVRIERVNHPGLTNVLHKIKYLEIPVNLKLRTNEIGYFTYYGLVGFSAGFRLLKAQAVVTAPTVTSYSITDYNGNIGFANLSLSWGAGAEYSLGGNTALVGALIFRNGIVDVTRSVDGDRVISNYLGIEVGIIF